VTDQRERVSTDPGIGPIDADNTATLHSIEAAVEVEPDGASLYYEPKLLIAVSDHRTLEMQTVKLSEEIDPRKLPTELSLPRSPFPPQYDSGWPQAEVVLTTSQRPAPPRRRWRAPVVLLSVLTALLLLVLARSLAQHAAEQHAAASAPHSEPAALPLPAPATKPAPPIVMQPAPLPSALASAPSAPASASASGASHAPKHASSLPHHTVLTAAPKPSPSAAALSEPTAKPKRAIY
jgi:hypothetical protein